MRPGPDSLDVDLEFGWSTVDLVSQRRKFVVGKLLPVLVAQLL